ncbi:TPA: restriction endonuclease subunit S [Haemophilus influenzae]|uniref:restriction endonuclease subunit S n=1 Tax=Haemophilus influenzae TaxID=727 RepID=UPI000E34EB45|nr:restriction endonuclease subunit S [Haemophilus influenzae]MCK9642725.1 restriction endonuclease subunit S [Haemophilus influenzae]
MKNNRTFLEKLLDGSEVEWKPLWSITTWDKRFNAVEKEKQPKVIKYHYYLASELKPLIVDGGNVKLLTTNESDIWTTEELVQNNISEGEIIAIPWGGNPIVQYYKGKFVTADNRIATSNNTKILDNKFLYYFLLSKLDVISSFYRGSGIKHPSMYHVLEMLIPIPPLSVQTEIVKILDALTALTSELTSELILRQKQYEYYREKLLNIDEMNKVTELGDVGPVRMCKRILKNQTANSGDIPFYKIGTFGKKPDAYISNELFQEYKQKYSYPKKGDILISASGTIGRTVIFDGENSYFQDSNIVWIDNDETLVLNKYLYHFYKIAKWGIAEGGTIQRLYNDNLKKVKISIPPLKEQHRIVSILDKFETLTNSITEGLPLAIEQSQKRYEYYRELLLNFHNP